MKKITVKVMNIDGPNGTVRLKVENKDPFVLVDGQRLIISVDDWPEGANVSVEVKG